MTNDIYQYEIRATDIRDVKWPREDRSGSLKKKRQRVQSPSLQSLSPQESLRIRLDNKSTIFQNLNGAVGDVSISDDAYPKVKNTAYGTEPIVIHGNGPSKVSSRA